MKVRRVGAWWWAMAGVCAAAAAPAGADFEGAWLGTVTAPQATAEIGFVFRRTGRGLAADFHMPEMFMHGAPVGRAEPAADGGLRCAALDTELRRDGERLIGTFGLSRLPVALRRVAALPATAPVPLPAGAGPSPAPRWTARLGAEVWATPEADADTVFVGTADGKFHALEATTGRPRWVAEGERGFFGRALATPTHVYALDAATQPVAWRKSDGRRVWRADLHDEAFAGARAEDPTFNRRTATPVPFGDALLVGSTDGCIYALDAATGAVRWRHAAGTAFHAAGTLDGDRLWLGGHDGTLIAFDPAARREIVRTRLPGALSAAPIAAHGHVVVGCRDYTLYGLRREDLGIAWRHTFWFSWIESAPALADGVLYVGGSDYARVSAIDPADGRAHWARIVGGLSWGTPLVGKNTVYAGTSAQAGALLPHAGAVTALDRRTGAPRWRFPLPSAENAVRAGVIGSPVQAAGLVVVAAFDGTVLAFPSDD